ncbi:MAG: ABC transporter permease, partial [Alphaproteobacteria bacterium]
MAPNRSWFKPADDGSLALMKRLFSETGREFAPRYAYIIGLNLIVAGTTALYAWMIRDVVNEIFFEKNERMLYVLIVALMIIGVVRGFAIYVSTVNLGKIGNAIIARVQNRLFDHMLNLGVDFYNRTSAGELVTRISHNATAAREVLDLMVTSVGRDVLSIIALVIVMFVQSPLMSLIVLVIGPIAILGITKLVRRVRGVARAQFTSLSMVISAMQETARGIRVIKAFNLEPIMRKRMGHSIDEVRQRADKIVRIGARASPLMEIMGGVAIACVVFLSGYQIIYMGVNPGELMSFVV